MVFIIAEAGINHNGSLEKALEMVELASSAGADAVKFQTFKAERLICKQAPKADYQVKKTGQNESQLEMIRKHELGEKEHMEIKRRCEKLGIEFMSTPFDFESVDLLSRLGVKRFKIPSGEVTNLPLLRKVASRGIPVILSTGMSNLSEVAQAIDILCSSGLRRNNLSILHCTSEYPTPYGEVNLNAIRTMSLAFPGIDVGYSDHTPGIEISIAALAVGAKVIEKHFTLNKSLPGPDHMSSLNPEELRSMVIALRNVEKAMGDGIKRPEASEIKNMPVIRRSIVARKAIPKGEVFTEKNLDVKRPGDGLSPMLWDAILGRLANKDYEPDDLIER